MYFLPKKRGHFDMTDISARKGWPGEIVLDGFARVFWAFGVCLKNWRMEDGEWGLYGGGICMAGVAFSR